MCTPFLLVLWPSKALKSLQSACFENMASDREKWSNYVRSCISGTYGVNGTPFWAGNHALDPKRYGQPLRNETERSHITRFVG